MTLEEQKCVSCEGLEAKLSDEEVNGLLAQTPGWERSGDMITREFKFSNFVDAMKFANRITKIAEEENHHPDLHISYGKARVDLSTHKVGGLSHNDFVVAAKISRLWDEDQHDQAI
jgi:4a-hydroxytetrahydrobiopterin dehydratase